MPAGRPSGFDPEFCKWGQKLTFLGATNREVAEFLEVSEQTLNRWRHEFPEFCDALKTGKQEADERVKQSLYRRAVGYSFDAVKIFPPGRSVDSEGKSVMGEPVIVPYVEHCPPDTTACIFWLKNRIPAEWRDRQEPAAGEDIAAALRILAEKLST